MSPAHPTAEQIETRLSRIEQDKYAMHITLDDMAWLCALARQGMQDTTRIDTAARFDYNFHYRTMFASPTGEFVLMTDLRP